MPFIEVSSGGSSLPDGAYPVQLSDIRGPKTVTAQRGPNAGSDIDLLDWVFHVAAPGTPHDGEEIVGSTSTASGPRSKLYAWLTALMNGVAPAPGTRFEKDQLIGRLAVATIQKDQDGWPRLTNLSAMPVANQQAAFAASTGAPVAPQPAAAAAPVSVAPAAAPAAVATDDLPF
jgi:hypothetical protein